MSMITNQAVVGTVILRAPTGIAYSKVSPGYEGPVEVRLDCGTRSVVREFGSTAEATRGAFAAITYEGYTRATLLPATEDTCQSASMWNPQ